MSWGGIPGSITGRGSANDVRGLKDLCEWVGVTGVHTVVEVGAFAGDATTIFANFFRDATVYAVDPWEADYDNKSRVSRALDFGEVGRLFDQHVRHYPNVRKLKMSSTEASRRFQYVDFLYLDACHQYPSVKADVRAWKSRVTGVFAGHDFCRVWPGVVRAVREEFGEPHKKFCETSWAVRI